MVPMQPKYDLGRRVRQLTPPALLIAVVVPFLLFMGVGSSFTASRAGSARSATQHATVILAPTHPGTAFAQGAVGLSLEADDLATRDLSASHKSLVALMRLLGPGILRIGGNSLDYSWWTGDGEQPPAWATSVVTPSGLIMLRRLLSVTGWRAIVGVDLGHFDPLRAASEAQAAERILGSSLLGFEIGNRAR